MSEETGAVEGAAPTAAGALEQGAGAGEGDGVDVSTPTWFEGLPDDDLTYIKSKGWDKPEKGPADILKSYRNLERLRGVKADRLVKLPENDEELAEFRSRLGVPASAEEYESPEVLIGEEKLDPSVFSRFSHELGLHPTQHAKLMEMTGEFLAEQQKVQQEQARTRDVAEQVELEKEWGDEKDANMLAAGKAMRRFGLDEEAVNKIQIGLGYRGTVEFFARVGRALGEGRAPAKDSAASEEPFGLTPAVADRRLDELMRDKGFQERLFNGDVKAREQWESLKKVAYRT